MRRAACRASALALALAAALAAGAARAGEATLQGARSALDARDFARALPQYDALLRARPDDADLLIEAARAYAFDDRHREAIALYRRVIEVAPGRRADVLAALAWQLLWSGDAAAALPLFAEARGQAATALAQAELWRGSGEACAALAEWACTIDAYGRALALDPGNRDLRRSLATAWRWQDDFARSEAAWRALLAEDPADRRALLGLARTLNAAGRHNAAVALYAALPAQDLDEDARLDQARALRWAGYDGAAFSLLQGRTDAEAVWLRDWRAGRTLRPYAYASAEYSTDADDLDIASLAAAAATPIAAGWVIEAGYRYAHLDSPQGTVGANRVFAVLSGLVGTPGVAPPGLLVPTLSVGLNDYDGWRPVTGNASLRWLPADLWRVTADIGREVVETPQAIANRITADTFALGAEVRLPPRWTLAAAVSALGFSDGNDRRRVNGRVEYAVRLGQPRVAVGIEGAAFNDSLPASYATPLPPGTLPNNGYWNPERYAEGRVFAAISSEPQPWEWYARAALGVSRETDGDGITSTGHPNLIEAGIAYDLSPSLRWRLFAGASGSSFGVGNGGTGYWRRYAGFTLIGWF